MGGLTTLFAPSSAAALITLGGLLLLGVRSEPALMVALMVWIFFLFFEEGNPPPVKPA